MDATIRLEHELLAVERDNRVHAMLELAAPPVRNEARPPITVALVIDRSGSMAGEKLATTKACAAFLARRLAPTDQLGLVVYDDDVHVMAPLGPVRVADLLAAIDRIAVGGSTNLSGGWLKGMEMLRAAAPNGIDPSPRKVILLTDGLANVGITDRASLVALAANAFAAGIGTTTIGFGAGFDEELLTGMADAGGGRAYYAATPDEAPAIFADEFAGLTSLVAQNVSVEIRPRGAVSILGVLNDYPAIPAAGGVQLILGDAYANDRRRVVFELEVPGMAELGVVPVADVVVRYVTVGDQVAMRELTLPITVNMVTAADAREARPDPEVAEEIVVLLAAKARDEAKKLADEGRFDEARGALAMAAKDLRARAPGSRRADELLADADGLDDAIPAMAPAMYSAEVRKSLHFEAYKGRRRRR